MLAIIVSTWWVEGMRVTLESGIPWLVVLSLCYFVWGRKRARASWMSGAAALMSLQLGFERARLQPCHQGEQRNWAFRPEGESLSG